VFLGFNRPKGQLFERLQGALSAESGPLMMNWFIAGHEIPEDHWYFSEKEGGRVLGNLCHWTDLTLHLVGLYNVFPCTIVPGAPAHATSDFVITVICADRSCAAITFSAKGHMFEGVREILNVHKGDVLANLTDFWALTIEVAAKKKTMTLRHRDHGHAANIVNSLTAIQRTGGETVSYVAATARFFLAARQAIETGKSVVVTADSVTEPLVMA
jgi:hypothetical protein